MAKNETRTGWHRIGECPVDAGCIMLVNPCYVLPDRRFAGLEPKVEYDYATFLADSESEDSPLVLVVRPDDNRSFEAGLIVSSGWGDGVYPVYGRFGGGRCLEVRVVFDEQGEEDRFEGLMESG